MDEKKLYLMTKAELDEYARIVSDISETDAYFESSIITSEDYEKGLMELEEEKKQLLAHTYYGSYGE